MKKIILLSLIISSSSFLFAQQSRIDSLMQVLKAAKEDSNKVKTLYLLSTALTNEKPTEAIEYGNQGISLAKKIAFKKGISTCLNALGNANSNLGETEKSLNCFKEQLSLVSEMNDSLGLASVYDNLSLIFLTKGNIDTALELRKKAMTIYSALRNQESWLANGHVWIGNMHKDQGNYSISLENYLQALKIYEKLKDTSNSANALINISSIYRFLKQYEKAKKYALDAKEIFKKSNNQRGIGFSLYRLSLIYAEQNNIDSSTEYLLEAKKIFEKTKSKYFLALTNNQLGANFLQISNLNTALIYFKDALFAAQEMDEKSIISSALGDIGMIYKEQKNYLKALEYANKSEKLLKEINDKDNLKSLSIGFIQIYSRLNKPDSTLKYFELYQQLSDTIYNEQSTKAISEMQTKYETEKKDNQILLLNKDKEIKEGKIKQQSRNIILIAAIAASALLAAFLIFLLYKRRKTKYNLKVQQMDNKFLRFQLKPHFVSNALVAIRKYIRQNPEMAEDYFDKYSNLMRDVLINSEKEKIALEEELSMLKKYMDLESLRIKNGFEYEVSIESSIDEEAVKVPPLILQPLVENAIWHGIAGRTEKGKITINISLEKKILRCVVENHCGGTMALEVEHEEKRKSFGLQISRERLKLLSKEKKGKWYLETTPETDGMKVQLGIPV